MHYYKLIVNDFSHLWENGEALNKYLERLRELMEEDKAEEIKNQDVCDSDVSDIHVGDIIKPG